MKLENLVGKEIMLFPNDTYQKNAILLEINDKGFLFKITTCHKESGYNPSDIVFFNNSCKVVMRLINLNKTL